MKAPNNLDVTKDKYLSELTQRVDEVLYYVWDPIGVSDAPEARDEYTSYVARICSALDRGLSASGIAKILDRIITDSMGMDSQMELCHKVAEILLEWAGYLREEYLQRPRRAI